MSRSKLIAEEGRSRFRQRVKGGGSLSVRFASRLLRNFNQDLVLKGLFEEVWKLFLEVATAILRTVSRSSDERVDEKMFVAALLIKVNQQT